MTESSSRSEEKSDASWSKKSKGLQLSNESEIDPLLAIIVKELIKLCLSTQKNSLSQYDPDQMIKIDTKNINSSILPLANPAFNLKDYDTRNFKSQYNPEYFVFYPDEVISFTRDAVRHEVFIELDNRTETNQTQIQKILNYISYALDHPDRKILVSFPLTDGSLPSKRITSYQNSAKKLSILNSKFLESFVPDENGEKIYLRDLYSVASNLTIFISGVSEAHIDIAPFLLDAPEADVTEQIKDFMQAVKSSTPWDVVYYANAKKSSRLEPEGYLLFEHRQSEFRFIKSVIAGKEHALDTTLKINKSLQTQSKNVASILLEVVSSSGLTPTLGDAQLIQLKDFQTMDDPVIPLVIFPKRERFATAPVIKELVDSYGLKNTLSKGMIYLQSRYGISNNWQLQVELRHIIGQYPKELKKLINSSIDSLSRSTIPKLTSSIAVDQSQLLKQLADRANSLKESEFISNIRLTDIPIDIYRELFMFWIKTNRALPKIGTYSLPLLLHLPFLASNQVQQFDKIHVATSTNDSLYYADKVSPISRTKIIFK